MKKKFKEISFVNSKTSKFQFDLVSYQDLIKLKPADHNQFEFHKISFYVILLFTKNEGEYNLNFKDYEFKPGSLFTLRKDNIHKFYKNKGQGQLLVFTENFILNHTNEIEAAKTFTLFNEMLASPKLQLNKKEYQEVLDLVELIKNEYSEAKDDFSLSIIRNYIQVIITKLFRIKATKNSAFNNRKHLTMFLQLQELIEKQCFKHKKVSYYANELGVTTKTLNNVTQSVLNKSTKSLINEVVILQSKRLIINTQDSLTEIAYKVGFDEPTNFFKYFRKYAGVSPSEFKTSNQVS